MSQRLSGHRTPRAGGLVLLMAVSPVFLCVTRPGGGSQESHWAGEQGMPFPPVPPFLARQIALALLAALPGKEGLCFAFPQQLKGL